MAETDAVAIVAGVEDINGEEVAKLHDDFTIGLITCWTF